MITDRTLRDYLDWKSRCSSIM